MVRNVIHSAQQLSQIKEEEKANLSPIYEISLQRL